VCESRSTCSKRDFTAYLMRYHDVARQQVIVTEHYWRLQLFTDLLQLQDFRPHGFEVFCFLCFLFVGIWICHVCCLIQPSSSKGLLGVPGTASGCVNGKPLADKEAQEACQRQQHVVISAVYGLHSTDEIATYWNKAQGIVLDTSKKGKRYA